MTQYQRMIRHAGAAYTLLDAATLAHMGGRARTSASLREKAAVHAAQARLLMKKLKLGPYAVRSEDA